jgi:NADPH:quinone reductase-like Zn-dependent oxidoreductase
MILRIGHQRAVPAIHIVRREEQVTLLRDMGARHVLNSSATGFESRLRDWCHRLKATALLDAVGGELTGQVLGAMPHGSTAVLYGALAKADVQVNPSDFIFKGKRVEGFWLAAPQKSLSLPALGRVLAAGRGVLSGDETTFSHIRGTYTLDDAVEGIRAYKANMSGGKVIITP